MTSESKETWYLDIVEKLDDFCKRVDEKIEKEQQQMKACKKKTELETKLAQEMKLHNELTERLAELVRRGSELDRVCATFESHLTIADSDRNRLDNAKETYQLAKELTGIRWDFSAPPNVAKGYIKSESRKLLQPIELDMSNGADSGALWALLQTTAAPGWPFQGDKENRPCNEVK
ncbi:unnamed protein product [Spodoptera exigua]|uniref:Kinetochore protein Spc24 n=1 Tax=Spodoptera exigua TaxID=7107 RepID=A0A835G0V5_SPOEX|nr:hypothetical protein HW555_013855 [Spodoptera exigua]KAF9407380.1 hypothetical protein HW555_012569 [Spodoptera exigua]CAH0698402.1 unnamed protein product [Spodoptera exigua]